MKCALLGRICFLDEDMKQTLKENIFEYLESNNLTAVASLAKDDRKVLSQLVRLAYNKDTLVGWRAIKAIGLSAKEIVKIDDAFLRETLRKLLWSLSDESGGIGWSAPEIIGEIVSADPKKFSDIIPLLGEVYDIEEKVFRPGVLYAFCRIAATNPELVVPYRDLVSRGLRDENPLARYYALELTLHLKGNLSTVEYENIKKMINSCKSDQSELWVYENEGFINRTIGEKADAVYGEN